MAIEAKRGCGYRKVGGLYLCGEGLASPCDRLPLVIGSCPTCGAGLKFTRGLTEIEAYSLWGFHSLTSPDDEFFPCACPAKVLGQAQARADNAPEVRDSVRIPTWCFVCTPPTGHSFLMGVGERSYSPQSFTFEAQTLGVSKRIAQVPKNLKLGETVVYVTHRKAMSLGKDQDGKKQYQLAVFYAFRPTRLEMIVTEGQAQDQEAMERLQKRGITPVAVPDDDPDHR